MRVDFTFKFDDNLELSVDKTVPAYKADENGEMVQTEDKKFSVSFKKLNRDILPICPLAAALAVRKSKRSLSGEDLALILLGATIQVDFAFQVEGEEVNGYVPEHTGYVATIKSIVLADDIKQLLMSSLL